MVIYKQNKNKSFSNCNF